MPRGHVIGDWGASRLRVWQLAGAAIACRREGPGILRSPDPRGALTAVLAGWDPERLILCGMAGAREGLHQVGYVDCPASVEAWAAGAAQVDFHGLPLRIAAGVACRDASGRPDVMRGEETQIFGALDLKPSLATGTQLILLPGTHSKWVRMVDGRISGFRTFITGELFGLLLESSLVATATDDAADEVTGFAAGLERASERNSIASSLFEARSRQLCDGVSSGWGRGFVSGLLVGAEIADMAPAVPTLVIGERALAERYRRAFAHAGAEVPLADAEQCVIAGLRLLDGYA